MRTKEIENLLAAFYEGETTQEEEKLLFNYFKSSNVPLHLQAEKEFLLNLMDKKRTVCAPQGLEEKLSTLIDTWKEEEEEKQHRALVGSRRFTNHSPWKWIGGVAASMILILSIWVASENEPTIQPLAQDTYTDPQRAYEEVQKALLMVSTNLNKGFEQLENAKGEIRKADHILTKQLDKF